MKTRESIAIGIPRILLPRRGLDLGKWAVIACDQHTSEPAYWEKVSDYVGDAPSALHLIYPEVYLGEPDSGERIARIQDHMRLYRERGIFEEFEGFVYVERVLGRKTRRGLMACLDLERYDFRRGASSLIRASEDTILERIPPRVKIREGASLEIPHIMVLIDDPDDSVIGPLSRRKESLQRLYDFELMMDSGRLTGYLVGDPALEAGAVSSLQALAEPERFRRKYDMGTDVPVLLFAVGDGNHALATAKTVWEKAKEAASDTASVRNSPLRYALVELVNLHDEALLFEPIHRVLFGLAAERRLAEEIRSYYQGRCACRACPSLESMRSAVDSQKEDPQKIGVISASGFSLWEISSPPSNLPVGTLQIFLDEFIKSGGARMVDYVHGTDSVVRLGRTPEAAGFYLPAMNKNEFFETIITDGVLPRKTFSLGEARDKRFYMEVRSLS